MHTIFDQRRYLIPFRATLLPQIFTDVLVIGCGVAGMRAALAAATGKAANGHPTDVIITTKGQIKDSNTYWAQGGIATVRSADDTFDEHVQDTLIAGADLCDTPAVRRVVEGAPAQIEQLIAWGMKFDHSSQGDGSTIALGREGGHSHSRILHADGDATGRVLALTLLHQVEQTEHVRLFDNCFVLDLITHEDPSSPTGSRCLGAITHHPKYGLQVIWAGATILASGGCGQVYRESTNPMSATGDGIAMAFRAGAELADLAFVQFHPTTLYIAGASRSLISEAVRGEGGRLLDNQNHRFMPDYDERGELAPRDIVTRAILSQMGKTHHTHVFLDVRHLGREKFAQRFPGIFKLLSDFDIDPGEQLIPVHPSCHYMIGGVRSDLQARTNVPGLLVCGEVASTGLHGANRLASNSLLEGLVFGQIAGNTALQLLSDQTTQRSPVKIISDIRPSHTAELDLADVRSSLRSVMWRHVGIERDAQHLDLAIDSIDFWARYTMDKIFDEKQGWEVQNQLTVGALITRSARWREESRGGHYRLDHPDARPDFRVHDLLQREQNAPRLISVTN